MGGRRVPGRRSPPRFRPPRRLLSAIPTPGPPPWRRRPAQPKKGLPRVSTGVAARRAAAKLSPWPAERPLRQWQEDALEALAVHDGHRFLASATPAAGKTTFGLKVAHDMLSSGRVARIVVAAPTTHICRQWAADAARYGIDLEPNRPNADGRE